MSVIDSRWLVTICSSSVHSFTFRFLFVWAFICFYCLCILECSLHPTFCTITHNNGSAGPLPGFAISLFSCSTMKDSIFVFVSPDKWICTCRCSCIWFGWATSSRGRYRSCCTSVWWQCTLNRQEDITPFILDVKITSCRLHLRLKIVFWPPPIIPLADSTQQRAATLEILLARDVVQNRNRKMNRLGKGTF